MTFLATYQRISEYDSENLMYGTIQDVLELGRFSGLDVVVYLPLWLLIKHTEKLTPEEKTYAENPWTHVDFVIFCKIDKSPLNSHLID